MQHGLYLRLPQPADMMQQVGRNQEGFAVLRERAGTGWSEAGTAT